MPAPGLGGQFSPLLLPHIQARAPLKPGFLERHPLAPSPASSQTQHGFSLLSAGRSHLCSKAGWSTLCGMGQKTGLPAEQISTANQRWRKAHQNQGPALAVSGSGPAGTHKEPFYTATHTKAQQNHYLFPTLMTKSVFELQLNTGLASVFQAQGLQNPYIHIETCSKDPPRVNLSGHSRQKEIIHLPSPTSS